MNYSFEGRTTERIFEGTLKLRHLLFPHDDLWFGQQHGGRSASARLIHDLKLKWEKRRGLEGKAWVNYEYNGEEPHYASHQELTVHCINDLEGDLKDLLSRPDSSSPFLWSSPNEWSARRSSWRRPVPDIVVGGEHFIGPTGEYDDELSRREEARRFHNMFSLADAAKLTFLGRVAVSVFLRHELEGVRVQGLPSDMDLSFDMEFKGEKP